MGQSRPPVGDDSKMSPSTSDFTSYEMFPSVDNEMSQFQTSGKVNMAWMQGLDLTKLASDYIPLLAAVGTIHLTCNTHYTSLFQELKDIRSAIEVLTKRAGESPKVREAQAQHLRVQQLQAQQPPAQQPPTEQPPTEQPPTQQPPVQQYPAQHLPAKQLQAYQQVQHPTIQQPGVYHTLANRFEQHPQPRPQSQPMVNSYPSMLSPHGLNGEGSNSKEHVRPDYNFHERPTSVPASTDMQNVFSLVNQGTREASRVGTPPIKRERPGTPTFEFETPMPPKKKGRLEEVKRGN
ncbi:hypothetical protein QBC32DRAFT_369985 [Pseudoneurospora amorphoporcata]|uniref:Uncharacterized protein n=1 Tax=Pseudoneurospora amorphoporcata TaxID=241081 RepID=A0AAN6NXN7_9PEZI|nr:hypothetical protein QBC32DRAFT_369985 [Pseudoneurospora amorphoporcata]